MDGGKLEQRWRLLAAGFADGSRGLTWKERLPGTFREALELLVFVMAHDVALPPDELDQDAVTTLLTTLLPGRLSGGESYRKDLPDLLDDFLMTVAAAEVAGEAWAWSSAIDAARGGFLETLSDPDRATPAARPSHQPYQRPGTRLGRNDPCPCGSGKKYKHCCLRLA
ncbi:MAG: hypothetical protein CL908_17940 [Deltaproteobacteria bacterium]|nr:hypothetical protein [Deltaproteobacteria bacterium]